MFVIIDPVGNVPVFLTLTADREHRGRLALQAVVAAGLLVLAFGLFGTQLLRTLGISIASLQVAGGLLLILLALEELRGTVGGDEVRSNVALVPLATPLLAGPGAIAATMLFWREAGQWSYRLVEIGALTLVLAITWLALWGSGLIRKLLRDTGIEFLTRVMGLLLAAIAVQFVAEGVRGLVR
ncbi:MAG TPA: antibiotic resistance protein MarC [Actinobacteria bacterium]|nr:antibiotic resistance protein MarC [Actinomycetota bacterium]